jgi:hypothetical protein
MSDKPVTHFREMVFDEKGEGLRCDIDLDGWIQPQDPIVIEPTVKLGDGSSFTLPAEEHEAELYLAGFGEAPAYRSLPSKETTDEWLETGSFEVLPTAYWPNENGLEAEVGDTLFVKAPEPTEDRQALIVGDDHTLPGVISFPNKKYIRVNNVDVDGEAVTHPSNDSEVLLQEDESHYVWTVKLDKVEEFPTYAIWYVKGGIPLRPEDGVKLFIGEPLSTAPPQLGRPILGLEHDGYGFLRAGQEESFTVYAKEDEGLEAGELFLYHSEAPKDQFEDATKTTVPGGGKTSSFSIPPTVLFEAPLSEDYLEANIQANFTPKNGSGIEACSPPEDYFVIGAGFATIYHTKIEHDLPGGLDLHPNYVRINDRDGFGQELGRFSVGDKLKFRQLGPGGLENQIVISEVVETAEGYVKYGWDSPTFSFSDGLYEWVGEEVVEPNPDPDPDDVEIKVEIRGPHKVVYGNSAKFSAIVYSVHQLPEGTAKLATQTATIDNTDFAGVVDDNVPVITETFDFLVNVPEKSDARAGDTVMVHTAYELTNGEEFESDEMQVEIVESSDGGGIGMLTFVEYIKLITNAPEWPAVEDAEIESLLKMNEIKDQAGNSPGDPDWTESYWVARVCQEVYELKLSRAVNAVDTSTSSGSFSQSQVSANLARQARRWRSRTGAGDNGRLLGLGDNWALLGRG